jgi:hypothetical protein
MANTEGRSDENVESLLRFDSSDHTRDRPRNNPSARLRERMDAPMGERPAATVIRRSTDSGRRPRGRAIVEPTAPTRLSTSAHGLPHADNGNAPSPRAAAASSQYLPQNRHQEQRQPELEQAELNFPVVGSIVERPRNRTPGASSSERTRPSKFAQERHVRAGDATSLNQGFPSLNVPLGTFVKDNHQQRRNATKTTTSIPPTSPLLVESAEVPARTSNSIDELRTISQRDAQGMLQNMTPVEIQSHVQDLRQALPSSTLAFLQSRSKKSPVAKPPTVLAEAKVEHSEPARVTRDDRVLGKEEFSQLLSSISTYEDLDAAYATYVPTELQEKAASTLDQQQDDSFPMACDLLRSTAPRQNLWAARAVYHRLRDDWEAGQFCSLETDRDVVWPYPVVLPVSLRCLLDSSFQRTNGFVLHTYVLQSIYMLLLLRSSREHILDVTGQYVSSSMVYQEYALDDAVPTPPTSAYYRSNQVTPLSVGAHENVAYSTSSSSESATMDGQAFQSDPMWTLLSKMRIVPRLASLLYCPDVPLILLPAKALVSICGILAMIGQRSPGAASAIVQHPTLLSNLVERTCVPFDGESRCNPNVALPTILLLCTLARQSRVAALGISVDAVLLQILSRKAEHESEYRLQRWTVILWRTLLRYGHCLSPLSALVPLAAPHLSLGVSYRFSLASDFASAFATVQRCAWVASLMDENDKRITAEQQTILAHSGAWLASSIRNAIVNVSTQVAVSSIDESTSDWIARLRYGSSCFQLLASFLAIARDNSTNTEECKPDNLTVLEERDCVSALVSIENSCVMQRILDVSMRSAFVVEFSGNAPFNEEEEACACTFLVEYLKLLESLRERFDVDINSTETGRNLRLLLERITRLLEDKFLFARLRGEVSEDGAESKKYNRQRRAWLNRCHSGIVKFLVTQHSTLSELSGLACTIIGRLENGDEALAANLLSHDCLFSSQKQQFPRAVSPISTMMVRELCRTQIGKTQLDHSFKLQHGLGITAGGVGQFDISSLLSQADAGPAPDQTSPDAFLPVGKLWVWQILSGASALGVGQIRLQAGHEEVICILMSCLDLIQGFEKYQYIGGEGYGNSLPRGEKLYHLMNICLQTEIVLSEGIILAAATNLFVEYTQRNCNQSFVANFCDACLLHSTARSRREVNEKKTEEETNLLALLDEPSDTLLLTKASMRSLSDFVIDLYESFVDHGAQYPFFTKCIRTFLLPTFPARIRCELLGRLRGLLHLLSLEGDNMSELLYFYLSAKSPLVDESSRDDPEFLDEITSAYAIGSGTRGDEGFVSMFAVAALTKSLAISLAFPSSGQSASKRRIQRLEHSVAIKVLQSAARFASSRRTCSALVSAVMQGDANDDTCNLNSELVSAPIDDEKWNAIISVLRNRFADSVKIMLNEGTEIRADMDLLRNFSGYFNALLDGCFAESRSRCVELLSLDKAAVQTLIDFAYDTNSVDWDAVEDLSLLDEAADYLQIHNEQLDVTLQALHIVQDCVEQGWVSFTKPRHVLQLPISKKNRAWRLWVCYVLCLELLPHPETHVDQPTFTQMLQKITGDAVALRRELIEYGLVLREGDGSSYWRPHYSVSRLQEWIAGIPRRVI